MREVLKPYTHTQFNKFTWNWTYQRTKQEKKMVWSHQQDATKLTLKKKKKEGKKATIFNEPNVCPEVVLIMIAIKFKGIQLCV